MAYYLTGHLNRRRVVLGAAASVASIPLARAQAAGEGLLLTPRQTEGPYYPRALPDERDWDLTAVGGTEVTARGQILHLTGAVRDRAGAALDDAVVDIWQCDINGAYHHVAGGGNNIDAGFQGFGRAVTDRDGRYAFRTIKPVTYPGRTPHIHVKVWKGDSDILTTQLYSAEEDSRNRRDGVYNGLSAEARAAVTVQFRALEQTVNDAPVLAGEFLITTPV